MGDHIYCQVGIDITRCQVGTNNTQWVLKYCQMGINMTQCQVGIYNTRCTRGLKISVHVKLPNGYMSTKWVVADCLPNGLEQNGK